MVQQSLRPAVKRIECEFEMKSRLKFIFRSLKPDDGFSILEVMTASGLGAVVLIALLAALSYLQKGQNGAAIDLEFAKLASEIRVVLDNESACRRALVDPNAIAFSGVPPAASPVPVTLYDPFTPTTQILAGPGSTRPGLVLTKVELEADSITMSPTGVYFGRLLVVAERTDTAQQATGPAAMSRKFLMRFGVDAANRFTNCSAPTSTIVNCASASVKVISGVKWSPLEPRIVTPGPRRYTDAQFNTVFEQINGMAKASAAPWVPSLAAMVWGIRCRPGFVLTGCSVFTGPAVTDNTDTWTATNGCYSDDEENSPGSTLFATCCQAN